MFLQKRLSPDALASRRLRDEFTHPDIDKLDQLQPAERAALKKSVTPNELWIDSKL